MESQKKKSTSQNLLELINPAPITFEQDDDSDDDTKAKVVDKCDSELSDEEEELSKFKKNIDLLAEQDERYAGQKISRKVLGNNSKYNLSDTLEDSFSKFESEDENLKIHHSKLDDSDYDSAGDASSDSSESSESINQSFANVELNNNAPFEEKERPFQHMSKQNIDADVEKGNATRNQLRLWDNMLECRIQLQKCLITSNKLPQYITFDKFKLQGGADYIKLVEESKKSTKNVLEKLIQFQEIMLSSYPETKCLGQLKRKITNNVVNETDEEISSDSDTMETNSESITKQNSEIPLKRHKRHLDDYGKLLDLQHKDYTEYRNTTIQKWNDRTRIASGNFSSRNFSSFDQSTLKQIEQIMINRPRLIERTQIKRSVYNVLGKNCDALSENEEETVVSDKDNKKKEDNTKFNDSEIFDDSDFYHQLLRELIERKTVDVTDPVQLGRQWIEIQKLRSKMKKKVDTKATKGRKIRYVVHPKLVNFMAPILESPWNEDAKSELYNSLFRKNVHNM